MRHAVSWIVAAVSLASMTLSAREARARACSVASDCPKGYDCLPGGVATDGGPAGLCFSQSCQSNADCAPGFSCYVDMGTACVTAADGGQTCGPRNSCAPQWDVPCVTASDCGPGFACQPASGAVYDCGKDQDASQPAYNTLKTVPCSAVPGPPFVPPADSGFPTIGPICEAGTTCTEITWNTCVSTASGTCSADSDCPPTWTCGCRTTCGGGLISPGGTVIDAGCMMACIPPNSDLVLQICNGGPGVVGGGGGPAVPSPTAASDSGADAAGSGSSGASSSGAHGGCEVGVGADDAGTTWILAGAGMLAWARRGRRRRSRV